jgi:cob(I)alamin adenosyltransferase
VTRIYTRGGDDGTTGLLYGGRVDKSDVRTESYGAVDEAVATLGMARAVIADGVLADLVVRLQRELFVVGSELSTDPRNAGKLRAGVTKVTAEMVEALESLIDEYMGKVRMPEEFVIPGETQGSSFLEVARTVIRRAERRVVALERAGGLVDREAVRYLNRLADLVFVLARYEEGDFRTLRST